MPRAQKSKNVELTNEGTIKDEHSKVSNKRGRKKIEEAPSKRAKVEPSDEQLDKDVETTSKNTSLKQNPKKNSDKSKPAPLKVLMNKSSTDYSKINFDCKKKGKSCNFKISTWNIGGIKAWLKKGGLDYINYEKPDILCLQETKCSEDKLPSEITDVPNYFNYWRGSEKEGYAGVGIYSKEKPLSVSYGIKKKQFDNEGRLITAEYKNFYLLCTYVPNSGRGLVTLPKRLEWNEAFRNYVKSLDSKKPVIICGDMNVSHLEIDLANPKTNRKNAGFTQEERDGMTEFLSDGYVDTFRELYPEETGCYTFWTYMGNCRAKNVGWRLDYAIVSERLLSSICNNSIRSEVYGSDHCPITLCMHV